ncbi:MAG: hypothetical protein L3K08_00160, partial [Thermoplasmata archaeon]|nr:hypothetical protein [Thermoplasmata archaeon]
PTLFRRLVPTMLDAHRPGLIVLQHGMDAHSGDPLAALDLGPESYRSAVETLRAWVDGHDVPLLVTGGGGYRPEHVARGLARAGALLDEPSAVPLGSAALPAEWRRSFLAMTGRPAPAQWSDGPSIDTPHAWPAWAEAVIADLERSTGRRF